MAILIISQKSVSLDLITETLLWWQFSCICMKCKMISDIKVSVLGRGFAMANGEY